MRRLEPAIKKVWMIQYTGFVLLLSAGLFFFYELPAFFRTIDDRLLPPGLLTMLVFGLGIGLSILVPRLRYRFWLFDLHAEELYLERGILTRVRTIVPLRRIQHLDVSQNILEREFELGKLIVYTAGTQNNAVILPGLPYETAEALRNEVKLYIQEDTL